MKDTHRPEDLEVAAWVVSAKFGHTCSPPRMGGSERDVIRRSSPRFVLGILLWGVAAEAQETTGHQPASEEGHQPAFDAEEVTYKVAETRQEREAAFRLLHQAYVERALMEPRPSGMRVTARVTSAPFSRCSSYMPE